jgi:hypothetical protein
MSNTRNVREPAIWAAAPVLHDSGTVLEQGGSRRRAFACGISGNDIRLLLQGELQPINRVILSI